MNRIAIDLDEVLVPFLNPMIKWSGKKVNHKKMSKYVYRDIFEITEDESKKMVYSFYESEDFKNLKPIENSQKGVRKLKNEFDKLYIVTGRQSIVRDQTEEWIDKYFPNMFDDVILTNSYTENEVEKHKLCLALNINTIIDDNFDTCVKCLDCEITPKHFIGSPVYPWCYVTNLSMLSWEHLNFDI